MIDLTDDSVMLMGRGSGNPGKHDHEKTPLIKDPPPPKSNDIELWFWGLVIGAVAWLYFQNN